MHHPNKLTVTKIKPIHILSMFIAPLMILWGCSTSRHVPKGSLLLDSVKIQEVDSSKNFDIDEMTAFLRQLPNHKMLWSMKFRLGVYNMSGNDTAKWYNRWLRKLGEPPVIYDSILSEASREQLRKAMVNKGYLDADVMLEESVDTTNRKIKLDYELHPGKPHIIRNIEYAFADSIIGNIVTSDTSAYIVKPGMPLDRTILELQRDYITALLRNKGYYGFAKEYVTFNADTTEGSTDVDLTLNIKQPRQPANQEKYDKLYFISKIYVLTDYNPSDDDDSKNRCPNDTLQYKDLTIISKKHSYLRPAVIYENCYLRTGTEFNQSAVDHTIQSFSRLGILKFINVKFKERGESGKLRLLDAYILLTPGKSQSISVELEGTNSEGDLGVAAAAIYTHRNIGMGSETLTAKIRGAYESLSGNLDGLIHNRYMEYSFDGALTFPKFKAPFLSERFKRRINASTELNLSMSYQERPEYTRIISTAGWSYKWVHNRNRNRFVFTPIDINYVYLPESTYNFIDDIAPDNPLLRYSYEDHFIMRLGFSFYHTNKHADNPYRYISQRDIYTLRASAECAGNLLFLASNIISHRSDYRHDPYKVFGIHYSQYFKINGDFGYLHIFDPRNSLAFHAGMGVCYPYGNSSMVPFEKRFYGGGANGVRGWDVRTLGPGRFPGTNSVSDFINQCGDIRLDMSVEYRAKLFWILELGLFVDGGNIWTIHNYSNQPGGLFRFNSFYKEIAAAYGLGIRMDFTYFLLRFDLGMKAHNPAMGQQHWPIFHPRWGRDSSFHFSIGYPF